MVDVGGRGQIVGDGAVALVADEARRLRVPQLEVDAALDALRVVAERAREDLVQLRRLLRLRRLLDFLFPIDDDGRRRARLDDGRAGLFAAHCFVLETRAGLENGTNAYSGSRSVWSSDLSSSPQASFTSWRSPLGGVWIGPRTVGTLDTQNGAVTGGPWLGESSPVICSAHGLGHGE